ARKKFGVLTETVQIKKAIALAAIERHGMAIDLARVREGEADLRRRLDEAVARVPAVCPDLFQTKKDGTPKLTQTGAPSKSNKVLDAKLADVKETIFAENGIVVRVPLTKKTRLPSRSAREWSEYAEYHPFLSAWFEAEELLKMLQFFCGLQA